MARATGEYAFWLDADDRIEETEKPKLKALLESLDSRDTAFVVRCQCDPEPDGSGATVVDHVRLFPLRPNIRWTYRVHEQILPSLRRANIGVKWSDVTVRHVGYVDKALRARKLERDFQILLSEHEDNPNEPFVLLNLGSVALERGDNRRALHYLRKSLANSGVTDSITKKLYVLCSRAHQRLGEFPLAVAAIDKGLQLEPDEPELLFRKGILSKMLGDYQTAEASWRKLLTLKPKDTFSSYDPGIFGEPQEKPRGPGTGTRDHKTMTPARRRARQCRQHILQHRLGQRLALQRRQQCGQSLLRPGELLHRQGGPDAGHRSTAAASSTVLASASRSSIVVIRVCARVTRASITPFLGIGMIDDVAIQQIAITRTPPRGPMHPGPARPSSSRSALSPPARR